VVVLALKLNVVDTAAIMKQGRWISLTFLTYIHNQISHLSASNSMLVSTRWHHEQHDIILWFLNSIPAAGITASPGTSLRFAVSGPIWAQLHTPILN
jgi:hypothetical protein